MTPIITMARLWACLAVMERYLASMEWTRMAILSLLSQSQSMELITNRSWRCRPAR